MRECSVLKMSFLVSFKACGCQHQHVCLNYSLGLTAGNVEIPTIFVTAVAKCLHIIWYKETMGGRGRLQAAWMGASVAWAEELGSLHPCHLGEVSSKVDPCFCGKTQHSTQCPGSLLSVFPVKLVQPFFPLYSL